MMTAAMNLRHLLLGRKAMTNLDDVLKSRDIILPTKVHIAKAMVFPIIMYGCENWIIRLSMEEMMLSNCGAEEDSIVPWPARRSNQSTLEGLMLKLNLQYIGHLI